MSRAAIALAFFLRALPCFGQDTLVLRAGDATINGTFLTPHSANQVTTIRRGDSLISRTVFALRKRLASEGSQSIFEVQATASPSAPDSGTVITTRLDHRTLAVVRRNESNAAGRSLRAGVSGTSVRGFLAESSTSAAAYFEFELEAPSFFTSFADAILNASPLREGLIVKIPVFTFTTRRTEWRLFRVAGTDTITVGTKVVTAWVVDEAPTPQVESRRFWLVREPPFFPRDITRLRDGTVRTIEQFLVRNGN